MDIVIVFHSKDQKVLPYCLKGLNKIKEKRNVYLVCNEPVEYEGATYISESLYPFSKKDIDSYILEKYHWRSGWYFQQLLKLYAHRVIPNLSDIFLIVDSDTVFLNEVSFIDTDGIPFYATGIEYNKQYFDHMAKVLPGLVKQFPDKSGIAHHTVFQKEFLDKLFENVEDTHKVLFWKAMMQFVEPETAYMSGMSEHEIYFTYMFQYNRTKVRLRTLVWQNLNEVDGYFTSRFKSIQDIIDYCGNYLHFVSLHAYLLNDLNLRV